jgi:glutamate carboxypeptidase
VTDGERVDLLRDLVEIESPSGETAEICVRLERELASLGAVVERDGAHLVGEVPGAGAPVLLLAHMDTVWPRGTLARMPWRVEDGRAYGPGVYDMKAGIVVMLAAVAQARSSRALRIVVTADEEIGSPEGRAVLARAAAGAAAALVVEPPGADGHLKTARKGLGRFAVRVRGRPAHASAAASGVNAVEELAHQILRLQAASRPERGTSYNVGVVSGGTGENVVPAEAVARVDVRVARMADRAAAERFLASLEPVLAGAAIEVTGGWTRPPLEPSPGSDALFAAARRHGLELGLDLQETSSGGGSDGNLVGALGVPVLDGLGALGGGAHAPDEHVELASLEIRAELLARLLRDPGI